VIGAELWRSGFHVAEDAREIIKAKLIVGGFEPEDVAFEGGPGVTYP
jgi:hypothetical protein